MTFLKTHHRPRYVASENTQKQSYVPVSSCAVVHMLTFFQAQLDIFENAQKINPDDDE